MLIFYLNLDTKFFYLAKCKMYYTNIFSTPNTTPSLTDKWGQPVGRLPPPSLPPLLLSPSPFLDPLPHCFSLSLARALSSTRVLSLLYSSPLRGHRMREDSKDGDCRGHGRDGATELTSTCTANGDERMAHGGRRTATRRAADSDKAHDGRWKFWQPDGVFLAPNALR